MKKVCVGMLGGGTVGGGVYQALERNGGLIARRAGVELWLKKIAVKAFDEPRAVDIPYSVMTTDWHDVVNDPEVQVVVELVGGTTIAKEMILTALRSGKSVVTANKALLAACGAELYAAANENNVGLYFEASVAGGIPILKAVRESFVSNRFQCIHGIVNGTCNYILTQMDKQRADFQSTLKDAQTKGYAEARPSLDVDGHDAHHKITILTSLCYNSVVDPEAVYREGIASVTLLDIENCKSMGYQLKLVATMQTLGTTENGLPLVQAGVSPALLDANTMLANVSDVFNGLEVHGDVVGETFFYGKGAGQDATASAVVSDIVDAAVNITLGTPRRYAPVFDKQIVIQPKEEIEARFYIRVGAVKEDAVRQVLSAHNVAVADGPKAKNAGDCVFCYTTCTAITWGKMETIMNDLRKLASECFCAPIIELEKC